MLTTFPGATDLMFWLLLHVTHISVVTVEVAAVVHERLDILDELALEHGLDLDELGGDAGRLRRDLLPRVAQRVDALHLLLEHRQVVPTQHRVRLLCGQEEKSNKQPRG